MQTILPRLAAASVWPAALLIDNWLTLHSRGTGYASPSILRAMPGTHDSKNGEFGEAKFVRAAKLRIGLTCYEPYTKIW